jgi:hypothetical protein
MPRNNRRCSKLLAKREVKHDEILLLLNYGRSGLGGIVHVVRFTPIKQSTRRGVLDSTLCDKDCQ